MIDVFDDARKRALACDQKSLAEADGRLLVRLLQHQPRPQTLQSSKGLTKSYLAPKTICHLRSEKVKVSVF